MSLLALLGTVACLVALFAVTTFFPPRVTHVHLVRVRNDGATFAEDWEMQM